MQTAIINQLLSTNDNPPNEQASFVRQLVCDADDELMKLDAVIADMRRMIDKMLMQRKDVVKRKQTYRSILSHVRRLPYEILAEICRATLPVEFDINSILEGTYITAMNTFSGVCRAWRHAAITTPNLWTFLCIMKIGRVDRQMSFSTARRWLDRSCELPLNLHFASGFLFEGGSSIQAANLSTIVWAGARRWKKIEFSCMTHHNQLDIFFSQDNSKRSWDQLESLLLEGTSSWSAQRPIVLSKNSATLGHAPRLKALTLRVLDVDLFTLHLPWSQLAELSLKAYCTCQEFRGILRYCVNLEECSLNIASEEAEIYSSHLAPITMRKLRRFHIAYACMLGNFLSHIRLPILEEFRLSPYYLPTRGSTPQSLLDLFSRSGHMLKKLDMKISELHPEDLTSYFQYLPALIELRIGSANRDEYPLLINDSFLEELQVRSSFIDGRFVEVICPLPKLKVFELEVLPYGFSMDTFENFVRSRVSKFQYVGNNAIDRLERVRLSCFDRHAGPTTAQFFDRLRREGLDIEVKL